MNKIVIFFLCIISLCAGCNRPLSLRQVCDAANEGALEFMTDQGYIEFNNEIFHVEGNVFRSGATLDSKRLNFCEIAQFLYPEEVEKANRIMNEKDNLWFEVTSRCRLAAVDYEDGILGTSFTTIYMVECKVIKQRKVR